MDEGSNPTTALLSGSRTDDEPTQPLLPAATTANQPELERETEHSYTEFYARMGTTDDELVLGGAGTGRSVSPTRSATSSQEHESVGLIPERESIGGESTSGPIQVRGRLKRSNIMAACGIASALLVMIVLLWWVSGGSKSAGPPNWQPANAFEVSFAITHGTSSVEETGVAMVDSNVGAMRVSYYSGMTTYIFNKTGPSWSVVPDVDRLTCLVRHEGMPLQQVFPDVRKFKYVGQKDIIVKQRPGSDLNRFIKKGTLTCAVWTYRPSKPDADGFQGTYTLYTRTGTSNTPIRFAFMGRSVILGRSHFDNFTIDYFNYRDLTGEGGVDPFWLKPPKGMPCTPLDATNQNSVHSSYDLHMLFPENQDEADRAYAEFVQRHSVHGPDSERKALFHQTLRYVNAHNRDPGQSYKLGVNKFADWTDEERKDFALHGIRRSHWDQLPQSTCVVQKLGDLLEEAKTVKLPDTLDYGEVGLVRASEEQGSCGASWADVVAGVLEGQISKKLGKRAMPLSTQNLIDCAGLKQFSGLTCEVGIDYVGYKWIIENNHGEVAMEDTYPRLDQYGFCHFDHARGLVSGDARSEAEAPKMTKCFHVSEAFSTPNSSSVFKAEDLLAVFNLRLNSNGPLAVNVNLEEKDIFFYTHGTYTNEKCLSDSMDVGHSMLAVGFNLADPIPYTILRNTFGVGWGMGGYIHIAQKGNICGVATAASFVEMQ